MNLKTSSSFVAGKVCTIGCISSRHCTSVQIAGKKMENKLIKSQNQLREVMAEALGIYMAKEPKIGDQWQTESLFKVVKHAEHEFQEILRSKTTDRQYHNVLDLIGQMSIVAVKIREGKLK